MKEKLEMNKLPFSELTEYERGGGGRHLKTPLDQDALIRRDFVDVATEDTYRKSFENFDELRKTGRFYNVDVSTEEKLKETIATLTKNKELFASLRRAGMRVVQMDYVIGGKKNEDGFAECFTIVDKITGQNLSELKVLDAVTTTEVDQCFSAYLLYLLHALEHGENYWFDIHASQIVYGTCEGDQEPHAYLVDTDPFTKQWSYEEGKTRSEEKARTEIRSLLETLRQLLDEIKNLEKKIEGGSHLLQTRNEFSKVLNYLNKVTTDLPGNSISNEIKGQIGGIKRNLD